MLYTCPGRLAHSRHASGYQDLKTIIKRRESQNAWYRHKHQTDPEWRRERFEEAKKLHKEKYTVGSEHAQKERDRTAARYQHKVAIDYEWAQKRKECATRLLQLRRTTNPHWVWHERIYRWCYHYPWFRQELPWKTHNPVFYEEKMHQCETCGYARRNGLKLWWQRKSDPSKYDCHSCYVTEDWNKAMPEGYEGLETIREVAARKKELDEQKSKRP